MTGIERNVRQYLLLMLLAISAVLPLTSCGGSTPADNTPGPAPAASGKVVINGAVNTTFTAEEVSTFRAADSFGINLIEKFPCGVSLRFPVDLKSGSYPITDHLHSPIGKIYAEYGPDCGKSGLYQSTGGTLNLTNSGNKYSGNFQFAAGLSRDETKTINVSGSFDNIVLH